MRGNQARPSAQLVRAMLVAAPLALASALVACTAVLGPSPVDDDWVAIERPRFDFRLRDGSPAAGHVDQFDEVLEHQYAFANARLGGHFDRRVTVFLHDSAADAGLPSGSGRAYPATFAIRVVAEPPYSSDLLHVLRHELNHVIAGTVLGRPGTYFVNEGLAEALASEAAGENGVTTLQLWVATHRSEIPPAADLIDDDTWVSDERRYKASASFIVFLIRRGGASALAQVYNARSRDLPAALQGAYGRPLDDLEREWRASLAPSSVGDSRVEE